MQKYTGKHLVLRLKADQFRTYMYSILRCILCINYIVKSILVWFRRNLLLAKIIGTSILYKLHVIHMGSFQVNVFLLRKLQLAAMIMINFGARRQKIVNYA